MPLPKIHPLRKTYIDLRRCSIRLEQFIASEIGHDHDDYDFYLKLQELITEAMDTIPEDHI
jgi:hypothetical protein